MKSQIFGRKVSSSTDFVLLIEGGGDARVHAPGGRKVDPGQLRQFEIDNTRRAVKAFRERNIEGYVLFGNDLTHYVFTPSQDFVYPVEF